VKRNRAAFIFDSDTVDAPQTVGQKCPGFGDRRIRRKAVAVAAIVPAVQAHASDARNTDLAADVGVASAADDPDADTRSAGKPLQGAAAGGRQTRFFRTQAVGRKGAIEIQKQRKASGVLHAV
jgi:hypothetical protein